MRSARKFHRYSAVVDVHKRVAAHNTPLEKIDRMDVLRVYDTTRHALDPIYAGGGPRVH